MELLRQCPLRIVWSIRQLKLLNHLNKINKAHGIFDYPDQYCALAAPWPLGFAYKDCVSSLVMIEVKLLTLPFDPVCQVISLRFRDGTVRKAFISGTFQSQVQCLPPIY